MTFPTITDLPAAPQRTQSPEDFSTTADTFVAALPDLVTEVNTSGAYIDTKNATIGNSFQGNYSAGTTYALGDSVLYTDSKFYASLQSSNTGNTPDTATAYWVEILGAVAQSAPAGSTSLVASGAISTGDTILLNSDGTVSSVGISGTSLSYGSRSEFYGASRADQARAAFDSNSNKIVVAYRNSSQYPMAVVGTVSGTSISFGTPVVIQSVASNAAEQIQIAFNSNSNKFVVGFGGSSNNSYAAVGTVSGTSISFGSVANYNGAFSSYYASAVYDTAANRIVLANADVNTSSALEACTAYISGTSVSFGSVGQGEASCSYVSSAYDSNSGKIVYTYKRSNAIKAAVATVSGDTVTFNSYTMVHDDGLGTASNYTGTVFVSSTNKIVSVYRATADSTLSLFAKVGTVSGTSITYGSAFKLLEGDALNNISAVYSAEYDRVMVFGESQLDGTKLRVVPLKVTGNDITVGVPGELPFNMSDPMGSVYEPVAQKAIALFRASTNDNGEAAVIDGGDAASNLGAESFVGFSGASYLNGETATIQLVSSVNENQSGLTIGSKHYVQQDGSLSTTPDTPSVYAGLATATTKIIVKG